MSHTARICLVCGVKHRMGKPHVCETALADAQAAMFNPESPPRAAVEAARRGAMVSWKVRSEIVFVEPQRLEWFVDGWWMGLLTRIEVTPKGSRGYVLDRTGRGYWVHGLLPPSGAPDERLALRQVKALAEDAGVYQRITHATSLLLHLPRRAVPGAHHAAIVARATQATLPGFVGDDDGTDTPAGSDAGSGISATLPERNAYRFRALFPGSPFPAVFDDLELALDRTRRSKRDALKAVMCGTIRSDSPKGRQNKQKQHAKQDPASPASTTSSSSGSIKQWFARKFGSGGNGSGGGRERGDDAQPLIFGWEAEDQKRAVSARSLWSQGTDSSVDSGSCSGSSHEDDGDASRAGRDALTVTLDEPREAAVATARRLGLSAGYATTIEVGMCKASRLELFINGEWRRAMLGVTASSGPNRFRFKPSRPRSTNPMELVENPQQSKPLYTIEIPAGDSAGIEERVQALGRLAARAGVVSDLLHVDTTQHGTVGSALVVHNDAGVVPEIARLLAPDAGSAMRTVQHWPLGSAPETAPQVVGHAWEAPSTQRLGGGGSASDLRSSIPVHPPPPLPCSPKKKGSTPFDAPVVDIPNPCVVCIDAPRNTVFFPCRHLCTCSDCCQDVAFCPLCREKVEHRVEVWV